MQLSTSTSGPRLTFANRLLHLRLRAVRLRKMQQVSSEAESAVVNFLFLLVAHLLTPHRSAREAADSRERIAPTAGSNISNSSGSSLASASASTNAGGNKLGIKRQLAQSTGSSAAASPSRSSASAASTPGRAAEQQARAGPGPRRSKTGSRVGPSRRRYRLPLRARIAAREQRASADDLTTKRIDRRRPAPRGTAESEMAPRP